MVFTAFSLPAKMLKKHHMNKLIITGRLTRDADTASLTVTHEKNI